MGRMAKPEPVKPITIKLSTAARFLDLAYDHFAKMVARDEFTAVRPRGRGPGRRAFVYADEIELFSTTRDIQVVLAFRKERGRLPAKRKVGAK